MLCSVLIFIYNTLVTCEDTVLKTALIPEYCDVYSKNIYLMTMNYVRR